MLLLLNNAGGLRIDSAPLPPFPSHQPSKSPGSLTCVGHHQPSAGVSEDGGGSVGRPAGVQRPLGGEQRFAPSAERGAHGLVVRSQASGEGLRVRHDVVLGPFRHFWGGRRPSVNRENRFQSGTGLHVITCLFCVHISLLLHNQCLSHDYLRLCYKK